MSPELTALRDEAMKTSCEAWAIRKRWALSGRGDMAGPCPVCGGNDRFSINSRKNVYNCRKCAISGEGVIALVMDTEKVEFVAACEIITGRKASDPVDERRMEELRRQASADARRKAADESAYRERARKGAGADWALTVPLSAAPYVLDYLAGRAIDLTDFDLSMLGVIRGNPELPWTEEFKDEHGNRGWRTLHVGPTMLASIVLPARMIVPGDPLGRFGGVHITWLDPTQPKGKLILPHDEKGKPRPSKKVRGSKRGGAIALFTPPPPRRIVMGEGIETTATPLVHAFEADTAYWAGIDLGNMAGKALRMDGTTIHEQPDMADLGCFLPPDWCEELVYLGEGDDASVHSRDKCLRGLRRARRLRELARVERPELSGLKIIYVPPAAADGDMNDLAMREAGEAAASGLGGAAGVGGTEVGGDIGAQ